MRLRFLWLFAVLCLCTEVAPLSAQTPSGGYTPHRVFDARAGRFVDFETLAAALAGSEVVLFGERHGDPGTHRLELALLEGIGRRRDRVVVGLEMFERDAQPLLDRYLAGEVPEADLLAAGRPWPSYLADYRPLVELARARR